MNAEARMEINGLINQVRYLVDKDRKKQELKDELVEKGIKSWKLQIVQKDKELVNQHNYIKELEAKIKRQDSRLVTLENVLLELTIKLNKQKELMKKKIGKI